MQNKMNNYDFRTWQIDGKDSRSLVKLKEWWIKNPQNYFIDEDNQIEIDSFGNLCVKYPVTGAVYFPATLLPYFFDEWGIHAKVKPISYNQTNGAKGWSYTIFKPDGETYTTSGRERYSSHPEADHASYDRMFQLLEERLTN